MHAVAYSVELSLGLFDGIGEDVGDDGLVGVGVGVDVEGGLCGGVAEAFLDVFDAGVGVEEDGAVKVTEFMRSAVWDVWIFGDDAMHPFWDA